MKTQLPCEKSVQSISLSDYISEQAEFKDSVGILYLFFLAPETIYF